MSPNTSIYYQGLPGAYSHIVGNHFAKVLESDRVIGVPNFTGIFESIQELGFGIVPIENSYAGAVYENYFNLAKYDMRIYAEYFLPVNHCLASPSSDVTSVKKVFSHYQAIMQTEKYTASHGWTTENHSDTAGSAEYVSKTGDITYGAICSELAAEIYGLHVLDRGIQDQKGNTTRFFLVGRDGQWENTAKTGKISIIFRVKDIPGVLYKCLGAFATRALNITKIESLPAKDSPFEYMFWMDIDGFLDSDEIHGALEELAFFTTDVRILGGY
ncbi:MAG: prephenate dehydratase domain-containing protein [Candidatus Gracilibacteria bacterium]|nr:prephenate dehydratase domain-containing protein [Candidatus Gracilibacteria bacterium]